MRRIACLLFGLAAAAAFGQGVRPPVKATHAVELTDPAGDVSKIHSTAGDHPGFDVVKLALRSDGRRITVAATLKDPPGDFASDVVRVYVDTDNDRSTGSQFTFPKIGGFEYGGQLDACVSYADRSEACAGSTNSKAVAHWAALELNRYTGKGQFDKESVIDAMDFPGKKASTRTPIQGKVVESAIEYADLHVKPGQTIRLVVQETGGMSDADEGLFPDILLTLK
jgi:hypothetical protein